MSLKEKVKKNQSVKNFVHYLLIPKKQARPRTWVKWFVNPFYHTRKTGSLIRRSVRMDVVPFNPFEIGKDSVVEDFATINNGVGPVIIGDRVFIGLGNVVIGPVEIGNDTILAQHIVISGLNHNYEDVHRPISAQGVSTKKIVIHENCWIGANVVVTAGVTIGKHCIVAAGSVVTRDIPPYSVAVGSPARVVKQYNFETKEWERVKP